MSAAATVVVLACLAVLGTASLLRRRREHGHLAATTASVTAAAAVLVLLAVPGAMAAPPVAVTVSTGSTVGSLSTQISSNNVYAGLIDDNANAKANFAALRLPLVRIHVGDDSGRPAMPEIQQSQWSFATLDELVNDETSLGLEPIMNIKFAPDWMWTCSSFGQQGSVRDQTFQTYADYMARLVSYYNKGSMTTETGQVITNPAGTKNRMTYWEPWNEPDLSNETPCAPPSGQALTPAQYLTMWNAVTPKMLAVDPTLKFVGPATAGGQFGAGTGANNDYVKTLMTSATTKPAIISFHGYGYWDNAVGDKVIFDGDGSSEPNGGIDDISTAAQSVHTTYPSTPMWISEINVNAAWGDDPHGRPWGPLGVAWWGSTYAQLAPLNVSVLHQYNIVESAQFGLINDQTGQPMLPYWTVKTLNNAFPTNSTLLQTSSPDSNIQLLAARRPDGKLSVLVVNRRVDSANPSGGVGLPADVNVSLDLAPTTVTLQQLDSTTSATSGPVTQTLTPSQTIPLHFPGYGIAVLTLGTGAPPPPAPAVNLNPGSLTFASQGVGTTSAAQSVTVTNAGNAALSISSIAVAGTNTSDFARTTNCPMSPTPLAAGASCGISVTFTPGAAGTRTGSITITDNAAGSPQAIGLSGTGATSPYNWAANPSVDFDGDHLTDLGALYRGRTPLDSLWYGPSTNGTSGPFQIYFGDTTDVPVPGDYDGDGKTDAVIFRPSSGLWYGPRTGAAQIVIQMMLGQAGDVPVPGDYNGDGKTDAAIYRPSTGLWFAVFSGGGGTLGKMWGGQAGDIPVPRDWDGDGKTDPAVYRRNVSNGVGMFYASLSGGGTYQAYNGVAGDVPVPGDYNGDRRADPVVWRPSTGVWTGTYNGASGTYQYTLGQTGDVPIPGYYDNNKRVDCAIYRPSTGLWFAALSAGGTKTFGNLGMVGDVAVEKRPTLAGGG
jgi:hypothetical protein